VDEGGNLVQLQKDWIAKLEGFLTTYKNSDEIPEALFQLASVNEFNAEDDAAQKYYARLASEYPKTDAGKKAAGAVRRLGLVGKPIDVKGAALAGGTADAAKYQGKHLLVVFWSSTAEPVKREIPEIARVYKKYREKGFEVLGVCLDDEKDRAKVEEFLRENPMPGAQILEPGGMEGHLANEYGIISLPTMFLVDPQGKVVNRNIRLATEAEKTLDKNLTQASGPSDLIGKK
jgi:peroxiredoxin